MNIQKNTNFLFKYFPALISGLLLTLSFPKTGFSFLAFFALVPLLVSIRPRTSKASFYSGFTAGLVHFLTLIYWVIPTVHVYGGLHPILAVSTLTLLCFYLALYPAIFAFLLKKLDPASCFSPILAACLWTGLEFIRTYAFTGFSWGGLGYSQYLNLSLIQIADFSGVYGVSFLIVLVNYLLAVLFTGIKKNPGEKNFIPIFYTLLLIAGTVFYGHQKIKAIDSQIETAQKTTITVVQGNIKQDLKWTQEFKTRTVEKYIHLSNTQSKKQPDLVIWPETALPFYYGHDRLLSEKVDQCVRSLKTNVLIGSPAFDSDKTQVRFYNRAYMLNRFSIITGTYDKNHLVPFGEYVPLGDYLTFLGKITAQAGNFSTGDTTFVPLKFNDHKTGVLICFEILFPSIAAKFVKNGADLLTTITNDAWFGYTSAAQQHFSIAVLRAVENRRAVARAANTGISGFIDPKGKILETTALFTDCAVTRQVPVLNRISFYTAHGDVFALSSIVAICLAFMLKGVREKFWRKA
ncbi:MAG: apolipoprotein N-acyltransferase [Proteobacteria bacterium]|nr:apolipoprotein N-acyltransferase [Pseudomonadota bacterium]MBU1586057.1 apolipoprotein N-acyltransferase [Pseudomonadota bacterium]MBU2455639.1 apolipoprotein N-acyltransferase [Pseudomonadota bacterium]MBU2629755.1 apolipoprotein N-acyltransferase [Pseudomonadota bacterium]